MALTLIESACKKKGLDLVPVLGEAAFYGPKLDIQTRNIYGKEETIATIQVDILVPKRMDLYYINKENKKSYPIIIHRAILGSYERFIGFLLEATKGNIPFWLSPIEYVILPVSDKNLKYALKVNEILKSKNFYGEVRSEETLSKRILIAEEERIPFILVVGEKEEKNGSVALRVRNKGDVGEKSIDEILNIFEDLRNSKKAEP
jgi:threonyl-tRNA synthetase